ncbi:hypothetical protein [Flavobacterium sp.]|uniref:hypothetical protein n=1 Tax=Flavobacterium sp. TaxID=239 RepID=UPI003D0C6E4D
MISKAFTDDLMKKSNADSETKWTNNDDGTFSGSNGATVNSGESGDTEQGSANQGSNPDPPTTSSLWNLLKSIFTIPKSSEAAEQQNIDSDFFTKSMDIIVEASKEYQSGMLEMMTIPIGGPGKVTAAKNSGWIARKLYTSLDKAIAKKIAAAIGKGVVSCYTPMRITIPPTSL